MGLFDFLQAPKPELQLYGKLPIAKDYLRIGLGDDVGVGFRGWLDQHFSTTVERGEPKRLTWPVGFVLAGQEGPPLVGCMWNSTDAGGHRKFPFSLSVQRKRKELSASLEEGMAGILATWRRLEEYRSRALTCANGEQLMGELRGQELPMDEAPAQSNHHVGLKPWSDALWPEAGLAGLRGALDEMRAAFVDPAIRGLRLNLVPNLSWAQQVQAWIRLAERAGWLGDAATPNLFVHYTEKAKPREPDSLAHAPAIFLTQEPLSSGDAFRLCGVDEEWGTSGCLEVGARQRPGPDEGEGPALYPVECSLSQSIEVELA